LTTIVVKGTVTTTVVNAEAALARSIGDQELELLKHVGGRGACTVAEVADAFGGARGLSRTTVLTVMERLRTKGFLRRRRVGGLYRYTAAQAPGEVMLRAVRSFVEQTLAGSVSPLAAYLSARGSVSDAELDELETALEKLRRGD
jgi:predicted transcriptional regulator